MRTSLALAPALAACGFRVDAGATDADLVLPDRPVVDVAIDAAPRFCEPDATLRVCFSFDQDPLPATLANEGAVAVDATLTSITRVASAQGSAVQFGAQSAITLPDADVDGIVALEAWFRVDTFPSSDGERQGIVDSNTNPNISLFVYRADPSHSLRCGLGTALTVQPAQLQPATWHYVACNCENGNLAVYLDGTKLGEQATSCGGGGSFVGDGFTIGSDNNADPTNIDERIVGAIDGLRLWSTPLTPTQICERAGRTGC